MTDKELKELKKPISPTQLRTDIYQVLDQVLETGVPVIVQRAGRLLKIVPVREDETKLAIVKRDVLRGDPEDLVHLDWSGTWEP
jgi:antitoxin (DNA-binding transcriptional repressor) of toxin-antitoxin stability system